MFKGVRLKYLFSSLVFMFVSVGGQLWGITHAKAFTDVSSVSDQTFFGVWNGSVWTTVGKINYTYSSALAPVENYVKQGDYTNAKAALFTYYRNRTSRTFPEYDMTKRNTGYADITADDIFSNAGDGDTYLNTFSIDNTDRVATVDVFRGVDDAFDIGSVTFTLMARKKESSLAKFYSREQAENRPKLEVVVNGETQILPAVKDTYIRPGTYGTTNYGSVTLLEVKDEGAPYSDMTRRTLIQFDLSSLSARPTSATLKLYGSNVSGTGSKDIMVFRTGDTSWTESGLTWDTTKSQTFSWQGVSTSCDWNQPASGADVQWRGLISRFPFAGVVAMEYLATSNEYYAGNLIRIILDFIGDKDDTYPQSLDTAGRAMAVIRAYHYIKGSTSMDASANAAILKHFSRIGEYLHDTANYHPYNNWGIYETQALYQIAVYLPELTASSEWLSTANRRIEALITSLSYSDRSYSEASSMYTQAVGSFSALKTFGAMNGQSFSATFDQTLQKLTEYYMNVAFPDGTDIQYGDSDYPASHSKIVLDVGNSFNRQDFIYFGSGGSRGTVPSYNSTIYPVKKEAVMRSGWGINDRYLFINNGIGTGSHSHPDNLAVTLYGYGKRLLIDPGRYTYDSTAIPNWLRTATEAHNTIEVGDVRQNNSSSNIPDGSIDYWHSNAAFDYFEGSNSKSYNGLDMNRSVFFIKPGYYIVSDLASGSQQTKRYQQTWHMLPDAGITLDSVTKKVKTNYSGEANIQVIPADPSSLTASLDDGYYSSAYLVASNAKYASYVKNVSGDVSFDTVLYPTAPSDTNRDVRVNRLATTPSVASTVASALRIDLDYGHNGNIGYYYLSHESNPVTARSFDAYNYNGKLAYVETDSTGSLASACIMNGKTLKQNSTHIINSTTGNTINGMGIKWNGTTLEICGDNLVANSSTSTAIAIYAPNSTSVKLNGTTVTYTKSGDYIYAAGLPVWSSKADYSGVYNLGSSNTGVKVVEYDVTPLAANIDCVAALTDSSVIVDGMEDMAAVVRLNASGIFDVMNGSGYAALTSVPYSANTKYHIKQVMDPDAKTYDVYVTPIGGTQTLIAEEYAFRTGAPSMDDIGKLVLKGNSDNQMKAENLTIFPVIFSDNFNKNATGTAAVGWITSASAGDSVTVQEVPSAANKSVRITKTTSTTGTLAQLKGNFQSKSGKVTVEYQMRKDETNTGACAYLYDKTGTYMTCCVQLYSGNIIAYANGAWTTLQAYTAGTWYNVKIEIDTDTDKFDLYINGVRKVSQGTLRVAVSDIGEMRFFMQDATSGNFYIDNVKVYGN